MNYINLNVDESKTKICDLLLKMDPLDISISTNEKENNKRTESYIHRDELELLIYKNITFINQNRITTGESKNDIKEEIKECLTETWLMVRPLMESKLKCAYEEKKKLLNNFYRVLKYHATKTIVLEAFTYRMGITSTNGYRRKSSRIFLKASSTTKFIENRVERMKKERRVVLGLDECKIEYRICSSSSSSSSSRSRSSIVVVVVEVV